MSMEKLFSAAIFSRKGFAAAIILIWSFAFDSVTNTLNFDSGFTESKLAVSRADNIKNIIF
jgi:hypothetical protein